MHKKLSKPVPSNDVCTIQWTGYRWDYIIRIPIELPSIRTVVNVNGQIAPVMFNAMPSEVQDYSFLEVAASLAILPQALRCFYEHIEEKIILPELSASSTLQQMARNDEAIQMNFGLSAVALAQGVKPRTKEKIVPRVQLQHDPDEWW